MQEASCQLQGMSRRDGCKCQSIQWSAWGLPLAIYGAKRRRLGATSNGNSPLTNLPRLSSQPPAQVNNPLVLSKISSPASFYPRSLPCARKPFDQRGNNACEPWLHQETPIRSLRAVCFVLRAISPVFCSLP